MRIALVLALTLAAAGPGFAQQRHATSRGSALVGGTADFRRSTTDVEDSEASTAVVIAPNVLYLVRNRLAIGGQASLFRSSSGDLSNSGWAVGPAVRFFPRAPGERLQPYLQGSVLYGKSTLDVILSSSPGVAEVENTTSQVGASAGLLLMLTRQVGVSSELYWERYDLESTTRTVFESTQTNLGLRFGFAAFLMR